MKPQTNQVRLNLERLEDRQVMSAGNVTANVVNGNLIIRAVDAGDVSESIRVRDLGNARFKVEGFNGTKVNGLDSDIKTGVFTDVRIYTYGGKDNIEVLGQNSSSKAVINGDLRIYSGSGADHITIKNVQVGNDVKIESNGGGDDLLLQNMNVGHDVLLDAGDGNDDMTFKYLEVGHDVKVETGSGKDTTQMLRVQAGDDIFVEDWSDWSAEDFDEVFIEYCTAGFSNTDGLLKLDLNDGDDRVYLYSVQADRLTALLYDGSDYISMVYCSIERMGDSKIDGGNGVDGVNLFGNQTWGWIGDIDGGMGWTAADPRRISTRSPSHNYAAPVIPR